MCNVTVNTYFHDFLRSKPCITSNKVCNAKLYFRLLQFHTFKAIFHPLRLPPLPNVPLIRLSYFEKRWQTGSIRGAAEPFRSGAPLPNGYNAAPKCQRRCQMP